MSVPDWVNLPTVVLYEIYKNLPFEDRIVASSVCKKWREIFFYYPSWRQLRLATTSIFQDKNKFLTSKVSHFCKKLTIVYVAEHYHEVTDLIKSLSENTSIHDISLIGSKVPKLPDFENDFNDVILPFLEKCTHITRLFLSHWVNYDRMKRLLLKHQTTLLAVGLETYHSEKADEAEITPMITSVLGKCVKLEQLCLDSRWFAQEMMAFMLDLDNLTKLRNLTLRLDADNDIGSRFTLDDWLSFDAARPTCDIHANYVHVVEPTPDNTLTLTRNLVRLRLFYCSEMFRNTCIELLMRDSVFHHTIKTIWCISHPHDESNQLSTEHPFVVCSWRYRHLTEIVLSGSKFNGYDLVGMSRLRPSMQILIAVGDIVNNEGARLSAKDMQKLITKLSTGRKRWSSLAISGFNDSTLPYCDREAMAFEKAVRVDMM